MIVIIVSEGWTEGNVNDGGGGGEAGVQSKTKVCVLVLLGWFCVHCSTMKGWVLEG